MTTSSTRLDLKASAGRFVASKRIGFKHDRTKSVGASEVGRCLRQTAYKKASTPPDAEYVQSWGYAERGNVMEGFTSDMMDYAAGEVGGEVLWSGQHNQQTFVGGNLSATPDGMAINVPVDWLAEFGIPHCGIQGENSADVVLEYKSISPFFKTDSLPKAEHIHQTITQIGMIRAATDFKPHYGLIVYVNSDNYEIINAYPVKWSPTHFNSMRQRADLIMSIKHPDQAPPEGMMRGHKDCKQCEFAKRCLGFLPWVPKNKRELAPHEIDRIVPQVVNIQGIKSEIELLESDKATAEAKLFSEMNVLGTKEAATDTFKVSIKTSDGQDRYDYAAIVAAFKEKGGDPEQFRKRTKPSARLSVEYLN